MSSKQHDLEVTETTASSAEQSALLTGDPGEDAHSIQLLLDTIAEVTGGLDLDAVLEDIVRKSLQLTNADRAILFLGGTADTLDVRITRDKEGNAFGRDIRYSSSLLRRSLEHGRAVGSVIQSESEAGPLGASFYNLKLRAAMCAPMYARSYLVGAIYVDSRAWRRAFSRRDLALFGALSSQLATTVERARLFADSLQKARLERDVEIAQRIQQHLLPIVPENVPGVEIAVRFRAAQGASGDCYDFIPLEDGRLAVLIGDVTGHGVGAALLTHAAQSAIRSYLELLREPGEVVGRLNNRLAYLAGTGNFISLILLVLDPERRRVQYVNAGHPALLLSRREGATYLDKRGVLLGVTPHQAYPMSRSIVVEPGDVLFMRTDGVDETISPGGAMFGNERVLKLIQSSRHCGADEILQKLEEALFKHSRTPTYRDDVTMIALKFRSI